MRAPRKLWLETGADVWKAVGMSEIIFEVREAEEGGFWAKALGYSIFTQGEDWEDLRKMVRDAVACHFEKESERPEDYQAALRAG